MRISLFLLLLVAPVMLASPVPDFPFIASTGDTEVAVAPDRATISFVVMDHQVESEPAVKKVNAILIKVVGELGKLGVKKEDVTAADLEKSAVRKRSKDLQALAILGYDVRRRVEVRISDLANYPKIARAIFESDGVVEVKSDFESSREDEIRAELLAKACDKARLKGERLAKAAGVEIQRVYAVSDRSWGGGFNYVYGVDDSGGRVGWLPLSAVSEAAPPLFVPKEIEFQSSAEMLFCLER